MTKNTAANIGLAIWRLKCFYETFVQGSTAGILLNFCAKFPPHRQAENRQLSPLETSDLRDYIMNINLYKALGYLLGFSIMLLLIFIYKIYTSVRESDVLFYRDLTLLIYWIVTGFYTLLLFYALHLSKKIHLPMTSPEIIRFIIILIIAFLPMSTIFNLKFIISLFQ